MAEKLYEITSPRNMQAFLVVLFSVVVCALVLQDKQVPDLLGWSLAGIIGFYFNEGVKDANGRPYNPYAPPTPAPASPGGPLPDLDTISKLDPASPLVRAASSERVVRKSGAASSPVKPKPTHDAGQGGMPGVGRHTAQADPEGGFAVSSFGGPDRSAATTSADDQDVTTRE